VKDIQFNLSKKNNVVFLNLKITSNPHLKMLKNREALQSQCLQGLPIKYFSLI